MKRAAPGMMRGIDIVLARLKLYLSAKWAGMLAQLCAGLNKAEPLQAMPSTMMGLALPNPIGIAAGMDKTGWLAGLARPLGFGFMEVGSVTLDSVKSATGNLERRGNADKHGIVGVNILCLKDAEGVDAIEHYVSVARACLPFADYLVINLSSPCTIRARAGGRDWLRALLSEVDQERVAFEEKTGLRRPLAIKVAMDAPKDEAALERLWFARQLNFDGAIVVTPRDMPESSVDDTLRTVTAIIGDMALISVGGITTAAQMRERMNSGAVAVQLFTGLVEHGPTLARHMLSRSALPMRSLSTPQKGVS